MDLPPEKTAPRQGKAGPFSLLRSVAIIILQMGRFVKRNFVSMQKLLLDHLLHNTGAVRESHAEDLRNRGVSLGSGDYARRKKWPDDMP
jgi:hypothetical protein